MGLLLPLHAELICLAVETNARLPRRLMSAQVPKDAVRTPVTIMEISSRGCLITGHGCMPDEHSALWVKLPGMEPLRVNAIEEGEGKLACEFASQLYPADIQLLVEIRHCQRQPSRQQALQARCTLL